MAKGPDHYAILGLLRDATPDQIKRAYLEAAQRLHPDRNTAPGETEIFLDVKQAYETLSNPVRRKAYDASLPGEEIPAGPILLDVLYSRPNLFQVDEDQLVHILVNLHASREDEALPLPPLNICLVVDRSTSMKDEKLDLLKTAAIHFLRNMRTKDIFSVVAFSDRAEVIIPSAHREDRQRIEMRVRDIQAGGGTELLQGLQAGLNEVRMGRDSRHISHVILLTDGHTYGDEAACLELAETASQEGIGISAMGIGAGWNDAFLDQVAGRTGNTSHYIASPQDIHKLLSEKYLSISHTVAEEVTLEGKLQQGILLNYAFRLQPESGPIPISDTMKLGPVLRGAGLRVLFEFLVQPSALGAQNASLLDGILKVTMASRPTPLPPIRLDFRMGIASESWDSPPPPAILAGLSRLTLYRMQERARMESQAGDFERATRSLKQLAAHLQEQGHQDLAKTVLLEAENIHHKGEFSPSGEKKIKYGTRALLGRRETGG